jgi:hypothetical protein
LNPVFEMRHVTLNDIIGLERYEQIRPSFRQEIIDLKKRRRVSVGESVTFVFESFETVRFQIQEMIRVERIVDVDRIREEIETYNALLAGPKELSATMLIELVDLATIREELPRFNSIDRCVWLEVEAERVQAVFEQGRMREDKVSAVQYVRFPLGAVAERFLVGAPARLVIDHPYYRAVTAISPEVQAALGEDLRE